MFKNRNDATPEGARGTDARRGRTRGKLRRTSPLRLAIGHEAGARPGAAWADVWRRQAQCAVGGVAMQVPCLAALRARLLLCYTLQVGAQPEGRLAALPSGARQHDMHVHGCCAVPRKCNITLRHSAADLFLPLSTSSFTLIYPLSQEVLCASAALCNPPTSHSFFTSFCISTLPVIPI